MGRGTPPTATRLPGSSPTTAGFFKRPHRACDSWGRGATRLLLRWQLGGAAAAGGGQPQEEERLTGHTAPKGRSGPTAVVGSPHAGTAVAILARQREGLFPSEGGRATTLRRASEEGAEPQGERKKKAGWTGAPQPIRSRQSATRRSRRSRLASTAAPATVPRPLREKPRPPRRRRVEAEAPPTAR